MSRVHALGVVGKNDDGTLKVLISCSETMETWKFTLRETPRGNFVVLDHGRSGAVCGTLFSDAKAMAEGLLHQAACVQRDIESSDSKNVVRINEGKQRGFGPGHVGPDRATEIFNK